MLFYSLNFLLTYDKPDVMFPGSPELFSCNALSLNVFTQLADPLDNDKFLQILIPAQAFCLG